MFLRPQDFFVSCDILQPKLTLGSHNKVKISDIFRDVLTLTHSREFAGVYL